MENDRSVARPLLRDGRCEKDVEDGGEIRLQGGPCANLEGTGCILSERRRQGVSGDDEVAAEMDGPRRRLIQAIGLCMIFMVVEVAGGILSNSLAILTDAAHLLSDIAGFAISLFAIWMAGWQATPTHSFGYHRMEILGALLSIQLTWMITGIIVYEAIIRLMYKEQDVNGKLMFITAAFGVVVNVVMSILLGHEHGHHGHIHAHGDNHSHEHGGGAHTHSHSHSHSHSAHGHSHSHTNMPKHPKHPDQAHNDSHAGTGHHGEHGCGGHSSADGSHGSHHQPTSSDKHHSEHSAHHASHSGLPVSSAGHGPSLPSSNGGVATPPKHQKRPSENINMRGAYLHVLGDLIQSVGVMIAGAIVWWKPQWRIVDLICTLLFSALVLYTTVKIVQEVMSVLMEGTPREIDAEEVALRLKALPDVCDVHDLHIWAITVGKTLLACHVTIGPDADPSQVLERVLECCKEEYKIEHVTCQIEHMS